MNSREPVDILLVEDNPTDAELTIRALTREHLANNIVVAVDGAEALDFVFARGQYSDRGGAARPRLMLLDLKLPKVDGLEVLREIRADGRTKTMPVVVLTSSAEEKDIVRSYALGANSYVTKPVDFVDFQRAVEELGMYWLLLNRADLEEQAAQ